MHVPYTKTDLTTLNSVVKSMMCILNKAHVYCMNPTILIPAVMIQVKFIYLIHHLSLTEVLLSSGEVCTQGTYFV